ncbi:tetrameric potassium-selective cyclic nucleotide gated channel [Achlya hypogyna]|uniref:Tetrameric potassium-selective cyclic nucleotide gated channel n=1 Tax=Achlya hypogyna TaxID=1202772 RepID=A0A1V9YP29_ACHHY|nr:tetrameric potassium-selective cyclic nucleotide gated channel [Achlya hypogyna]
MDASMRSRSRGSVSSKVYPVEASGLRDPWWCCRRRAANTAFETRPTRCIIYPSHWFRSFWGAVNIGLVIYVCTIAPYVVAFYSLAEYEESSWWVSDSITDALYVVDIVVRFRSAYIDHKTGDVVADPRKIALRYIRGWFCFDVFAAFPWNTVFTHYASSTSRVMQYPRLFRVIRLTRIAKILRVLEVQALIEFCEDKFNLNRNYIVVSKLLLSIVLVAHFTACGFYAMGTTMNTNYDVGLVEGDPTTSWIAYAAFTKKSYLLTLLQLNERRIWKLTYSKPEMYLTSLYFAFTMMATVGFGDIIPVTINERIYIIFSMVISAGIYAFMIASVSSSVASMNVTRNRYFERLNEVNAYMESRDLPQSLQLRTRRYYRYFLQHKTVYDESRILEDLSTTLREEITDHYIRMTIKNITFFQDVPKGFTAYIAVHLKPLFLPPNTTVIKMGDYASEMFIVARGVLQVYEPKYLKTGEEAEDVEISFLFDGDHFGEMALLLEEQKGQRTASVRSKIYCELHALEYKQLQTGLARYPSAMDKLMRVALQRKILITNLRKTKITNLMSRPSSKVVPSNGDEDDAPSPVMAYWGDDPHGTKPVGILFPTHRFRVFWDTVNLVLLAYVCTIVPYVSSFYSIADYQMSQWVIADYITDVLYAMDIIITFRSAYVDPKTGDIISSPTAIARAYISRWLALDLFATFPWDTFFRYVLESRTHATQIPRLLRVTRLTRIAKIQTLVEFCEDKLNINRNYIVVSKLLLCILLVAHFTACGFYFMGTTMNSNYAAGMASHDETSSWIAYATHSKHIWSAAYSKLEMYISSLYFAFTMMATVGFGDFVPVTINERLYTIFGMVISAGTYAFMIASVSSSVASMNVTRNRYFERLNELNAYMESRGLPASLQLRTRRYYRYFLQRKTVYDESRILEDLSTTLREEITDHYIRMTIKNITFFQDVPKGFTAYIAVYLKPLFLSPNSTMGDYGSEMFIVARGVLQVYEPTHTPDGEEGDDIEISFLLDGDHFGEMALLLEEQKGKRTACVRAKIYCELHALEYKHLQTGLTRYPSAMDKLMGVALHRKALVTNLRKTKISNLITHVQKKTLDKRFKKLAAEKRFGAASWGLKHMFQGA